MGWHNQNLVEYFMKSMIKLPIRAVCFVLLFITFSHSVFAQNKQTSNLSGNFATSYKNAMLDIGKQSLPSAKLEIERGCANDQARSCSRLCFWQLMDKDNRRAEKNCRIACRLGDKAGCLGEKLVRKLNANSSGNPSGVIAKYLLDLTCKNEGQAKCNPIEMRDELNALLNKNSNTLAWAVGLGCQRGLSKSCSLADYLGEAPKLSTGGQDLVQALVDFSCNEQSVEACAFGALLKGMNNFGELAGKLLGHTP